MVIENGSFEEPGALSGLAAGWQRRGRRLTNWVTAAFAKLPGAPITDGLDFASAEWVTNGVTVSTDDYPGPDGADRADTIREEATNAVHRIELVPTRQLAHGDRMTFGVYMRKDTRRRMAIGVDILGETVWCDASLIEDKILVPPVPTGVMATVNAAFVLDRDGWRRLSLSVAINTLIVPADSVVGATFWIALVPDDGSIAPYLGDVAMSTRLWGAWLSGGDARYVERYASSRDGSEYPPTAATSTEVAVFATELADPPTRLLDTYESGWDNSPFWAQIVGLAASLFDTAAPELVEDHEEEWASSQAVEPSATSTAIALFGGMIDVETHAAGWSSNEDVSFAILTYEDAVFGQMFGDAGMIDSHEYAYADRQYTMNAATSVLGCPAHGLSDGMTLYLYAQYGGIIPYAIGVNESVKLHVVNASSSAFQVSLSPGGAPVDFVDAGTGQQFVRLDPARYWSGDDVG